MKTIAMISVACLLTVFFSRCTNKPTATYTEQAVCVKAEKLAETDAVIPIHCSGILSSKRLIKMSFKTGGIISALYVEPGQKVKKGQLLASLEMTEISSQVEQARLAVEKTERDLSRVKNLYRDTVATLEQLQDATLAFEMAERNLSIAAFNQQYSKIAAPADGLVIATLAESHELTGPGTPVLVFSELGNDEWVVKAGLADKDIVRVHTGDKAEAVFDAYPGRKFAAYVSQISETADPHTGTFEVELTIEPGNERMINGLVAVVDIEAEGNQVVTLVPPEAITDTDGSKGYVYVIEEADTTAKKVEVTIAYLDNQYVAVKEPINKMGLVITEGAAYLGNGSKIILGY
ncbi:MAG: efflux RND transporter periplasmic adaptor subunit [Bacteroidales bacterium]|nr:efflux RND transporter periplasmic adaptor subunit [Bacteroidales bacterium]